MYIMQERFRKTKLGVAILVQPYCYIVLFNVSFLLIGYYDLLLSLGGYIELHACMYKVLNKMLKWKVSAH